MTKPVHDKIDDGSSVISLFYLPAKEVSTKTLIPLEASGLNIIPLKSDRWFPCFDLSVCIDNKYLTICCTAYSCKAFGSSQNLAHWSTANATSG